ncbi:MAG: DUF4281 domain-containing protein [Deltaproteobacteria bacterium]|nr:DUF4281 domain-containing protein [Deltaproteobacteria bacterium]
MDHDLVFHLGNSLVLPAWLAMLFRPSWRFGTDVLAPLITPAAMALLYSVYITLTLTGDGPGGFGDLEELGLGFSEPIGAMAGWAHYLVADVFIGSWALRESRRLGIRHRTMVPILILLLMLMPVGFLAYLVVRARHTGFAISAGRGA